MLQQQARERGLADDQDQAPARTTPSAAEKGIEWALRKSGRKPAIGMETRCICALKVGGEPRKQMHDFRARWELHIVQRGAYGGAVKGVGDRRVQMARFHETGFEEGQGRGLKGWSVQRPGASQFGHDLA